MASLLTRMRGGAEERANVEDFIAWTRRAMFEYTWTTTPSDGITEDFQNLVNRAYARNGVVFAVMAVRQLVFSSVRFRWQRLRSGKPSDMFGTTDLRVLETPWVGGTTQDLLTRLIQDADLAGNAYNVLDTPLTRLGGDGQAEIVRLRPDWVEIVTSPRMRPTGQLGVRKVGFLYWEGGKSAGNDPVPLLPDEVSHFMPSPDPLHPFRGMSWLTPVIREIDNDSLMNRHKQKFFENGGTPNLIIKHAEGADRDAIVAFDERLKAQNVGVENAYKNLNLYPGADVTVAGADMKQLDFKLVQGAGETRIAAAGGVPPVIVGLSEGLQAATYSNYSQARRRFGDGTMHPLWQNTAGSVAPLLPSQGDDVRLWYDADNIPFLREDEKDAAEIQSTRAGTVASLINAGYTPESVIAAVEADDFRLLAHTGLFSVQLQRPGSETPGPPVEGVTA